MANLVLVDSNVLIDAGHSIVEAVGCLNTHEQQSVLAISVITQMELMVGCRNKREFQKLEKFLRRYQIIKLDEQISTIATDLLKSYLLSHGLLIADGLIAATALALNLPLLTKNQRDYRFISGLQLLPYP